MGPKKLVDVRKIKKKQKKNQNKKNIEPEFPGGKAKAMIRNEGETRYIFFSFKKFLAPSSPIKV